MSETRTAIVTCPHQWADETSDYHVCHLPAGHVGLHECGEDDECEATEIPEEPRPGWLTRWEFVRIDRRPTGFGVGQMTLRHEGQQEHVVVDLTRDELRLLAMQALAAMELDSGSDSAGADQ